MLPDGFLRLLGQLPGIGRARERRESKKLVPQARTLHLLFDVLDDFLKIDRV
jgi:hypothetical protein